eukprot:c11205_g1_i1 orf=2-520(-)
MACGLLRQCPYPSWVNSVEGILGALGGGKRGLPGQWLLLASKKHDHAGQQKRAGWGVRGTRMSVRDCTCVRLKEECTQEQLQKASDGQGHVDMQVYAALLRRCGHAKELSAGKCVHSHIIKSGYDRDRLLGNLLVQMYGNCGRLEDARSVFCRIRQRNVFSWNILLAAYAQNG